jgi:hypothetical protein
MRTKFLLVAAVVTLPPLGCSSNESASSASPGGAAHAGSSTAGRSGTGGTRPGGGGASSTGGLPGGGGRSGTGGVPAGTTCQSCAVGTCATEYQACQADAACASGMSAFFACLDAATADGGQDAADQCDTAFAGTPPNTAADTLLNCVHDNACSNVCQ